MHEEQLVHYSAVSEPRLFCRNASREFDPSSQLIGIPCLFSKKLAEHGKSRVESMYICLIEPQVKQPAKKPAATPPIADLKLQATLGAGEPVSCS